MANQKLPHEVPLDGPHRIEGDSLRAPLLPWALLALLLVGAVLAGVAGWRRLLADAEARISAEDQRRRTEARLEEAATRTGGLEKQLEAAKAKLDALAQEKDEAAAQNEELRQKLAEQDTALTKLRQELEQTKRPRVQRRR